MRKLACAAALACLAASGPALADLNWDFQLVQPNLGVIGNHDIAYGRATLSNFASSTSTLDLSAEGSFVLLPVYGNGALSLDYQRNFGRDEPFPWNNWSSTVRAIRLAPGESRTFDLVWFAPVNAAAVPNGNYSASVDLCLGFGFTCDGRDTRTVTLSWAVTAVPEPVTGLAFAAGLGVIGLALRRRRQD